MGGGVRFHTQRGGFGGFHQANTHQRRQHHRQQHRHADAQPVPDINWRNLMQLLPLIMLFLFTFWRTDPEPIYSLRRTHDFAVERKTGRMDVPFYVKDSDTFDSQFGLKSEKRVRLEQSVEYEYRDQLSTNCQYERAQQKRLYRWGEKEKARKMKLPHCDELKRW
mmetsp:Transcript_15417/g.33330  ORF Transcript_15417/g.33330 Transcript_15417/m.33330 type:complete len:165 (-) Transcript_15417:235-729(-)